MMQRCTIGTDPEFFLSESSKFKSAVGLIPGTKEKPHCLKCKSGLQVDNVSLEFCTKVARNGKELVTSIKETFKELISYIPIGHKIVAAPSAIFDDDQLETDEAKLFGCSADYNAWTCTTNPLPEHPNPNFRSCGGHIHVGHVKEDGNEFLLDPYGKLEVVKAMDTFHGIVSSILDNSPEALDRRNLYGGPGAHRPTNYGVEYRVLSNFWMKSPQLVMLMDSLTQDCLKLIRQHTFGDLLEVIGGQTIQTVIRTGNSPEAYSILDKYLRSNMSEDSLYYLNEVLKNMPKYDLATEWNIKYKEKVKC